jgi:hypothetical protein
MGNNRIDRGQYNFPMEIYKAPANGFHKAILRKKEKYGYSP